MSPSAPSAQTSTVFAAVLEPSPDVREDRRRNAPTVAACERMVTPAVNAILAERSTQSFRQSADRTVASRWNLQSMREARRTRQEHSRQRHELTRCPRLRDFGICAPGYARRQRVSDVDEPVLTRVQLENSS